MREIITQCRGFDWDKGNSHKNQLKPDVTQWECEQVFFNDPLLLFPDRKHSNLETRYFALGRTEHDRKLFIVFTLRNDLIRIISARDMHRKERYHYEQAQKNA